MITIQSPQNAKIKELIALRESKKRRETGLFLIEGARELSRALASGYVCRTVYVEASLRNDEVDQILQSLPLNLQFGVSREVFAKLAVREGSDGLIAVMEAKAHGLDRLKVLKTPLLLVMENIEKPGNLGALARSADGAGADAIVVLDPRADLYNPNAIRASIGALFKVPVILCSADDFRRFALAQGFKILAASPHATQYHYQADFKGAAAIVLGSEAWGLSDKWQAKELIKIPMLGLGDSLNVSVAGAVLLYEALRQRSSP